MQELNTRPPRILVVDDNRSIHDDFRKILCDSQPSAELASAEAALFGDEAGSPAPLRFRVDSAYQGKEALLKVEQALQEGDPYELTFMDVRMPPGWDGIETTAAIWNVYPDLHVVICTAYSDYSWDQIQTKLGHNDRLLILKKPFDNIEVLQLAHAMTEKWRLLQQARVKMCDLERMVETRVRELHDLNTRLTAEITERKAIEQELRTSQELLLQQERLAVVGQFAAGVAHDFNNIMTIVQGHTALIGARETISSGGQTSLKEITTAADRAAGLTQQLLAFSRKQVIRLVEVDLVEGIGQMSSSLARTVREHTSVQFSYAPNLPRVRADVRQLEHVLKHLISNADDAMPDGGTIHVSLDSAVVHQTDAAKVAESRAGRFVRLTVRDTGCGIDPSKLQKIFEPFFTTKDVGHGTGLGLSTVYGIARQHEGWVEVQSEVGHGSVFRVYLPQAISHRETGSGLPLTGAGFCPAMSA
jgi:signal transduction histidine kinase